MMNLHQSEEIAWLHIQDLQREAENRRVVAAARPLQRTGIFRRLFGRWAAAPRSGRSADRKEGLA